MEDVVEVHMRGKQSSPRIFTKIVFTLLLVPVILPLGLLGLLLYLPSLLAIYLLIWMVWIPRGKDVLFVSSDSPIWQEYMATQILPHVRERAVILNWSERKNWPKLSLRVYAFRLFGGRREFNPMIILFRPFRRAQTFRFLVPFNDWKHGDKSSLEGLSKSLFAALEEDRAIR